MAVVEATGVPVTWEELPAGEAAIRDHGTPLPASTLARIRARGVALKGPLTGRGSPGSFPSPNVGLRHALGLYARVRPCVALPGTGGRPGARFSVVADLMEDQQGGAQFRAGSQEAAEVLALAARLAGKALPPGAAVGVRFISPDGARRVAEYAFRYAEASGQITVTVGHKATAANHTDAAFLAAAKDAAAAHPGITLRDMAIDALCHALVRDPSGFEVLLLMGGHGDIVTDIGAALVGGLGIAPGMNVGDSVTVFEAAHGTVARYAGLNQADPIALIRCGALLLRHLGETAAGERIEHAVAAVLDEGRVLPRDLARGRGVEPSSTDAVARAIAAHVRGA
jgi:isocitrate dehydrogenase (NAD+)